MRAIYRDPAAALRPHCRWILPCWRYLATMPFDARHIARMRNVATRSISPENFDGSKGGGGRATQGTGAACAAELGQGWKISPSVNIPGGSSIELAAIDGPGVITHVWITTHREHWRSLVLRAYWDGSDDPA